MSSYDGGGHTPTRTRSDNWLGERACATAGGMHGEVRAYVVPVRCFFPRHARAGGRQGGSGCACMDLVHACLALFYASDRPVRR